MNHNLGIPIPTNLRISISIRALNAFVVRYLNYRHLIKSPVFFLGPFQLETVTLLERLIPIEYL